MHNNDVAAAEEQFAHLLEAFDEALAEGRPPPEIPADLPDELRARLVRACACLEALQEQADEEPPAGDLEAWLRDQATAPGLPSAALRLGRFRILRELGRGGSGIVFLARDPRLSRQVALKVPLPEVLFTPELRRRFLQEATAAACLDHANLVPVHDADEEGPLCYIVSTYCPGPTLAAWLRGRRDPVPVDLAARLVAALADAVAYIHGKGIIHRDIKPGNVLLEPKEEVTVGVRGGVSDELKMVPRLTDFGLAKLWEGGGDTTMGAVLGTPAYMAPEQASGKGKEVGPAADVYSLGVLLYELLTGQPPFRGETDVETLQQVAAAEAVAPRRLRPAVPRDLETVCLKCLEKEPGRRYTSAGALAEDLRCFLEHKPIQARAPRWWERLLKWVRRRPTVAALLVVSSAALVSLLAGSLWYGIQAEAHAAELKGALDKARNETTRAAKARQKEGEALDREAAALLAEQFRYASSIQLARLLGDASAMVPLRQLLENQRPLPNRKVDHRGFEWHYLWRLFHPLSSELPPAGVQIHSLALSRDGKILAAGTKNGVWLYDTRTGQILWRLPHGRPVIDMAFSPDGKTLAAGGGRNDEPEGELKLWDVDTGRKLADLEGHPFAVYALAFSLDGKTLAAASTGSAKPGTLASVSELTMWNVETRQARTAYKTRPWPDLIDSLAYSPDGKTLAVGERQGRVVVLDANTLSLERSERIDPSVQVVAYAPDGSRLAAASDGGKVVTWRLSPAGPETRMQHPGLRGNLRALAYAPDGKCLAAGYADGTIFLWDAASGHILGAILAHQRSVRGVVFTPDGKGLFSASDDGSVKRWDLQRALMPTVLPGHRPREAWSVAFSPNGQTLASAGDDGYVRLWDTATGKEQAVLRGHWALVTCVAFSPDGKTLASGGFDRKIRLWNVATRKEQVLNGHEQHIRSLAFSPDGKVLVSGSGTHRANQPDLPGEVKLWDVERNREMASFPGHRERVRCVAFSPDGRLLASGSTDRTVIVRDRATGAVVHTLREDANVWSLTFSPDGKILATGTSEKWTVRLWDVSSGRERAILKGHTGNIVSLAFTPNGRTLASASNDGTVKLWHMPTNQELLTIRAADKDLNAVAFDRDGRSMAVAAHNGSVLLYRTDSGEDSVARGR